MSPSRLRPPPPLSTIQLVPALAYVATPLMEKEMFSRRQDAAFAGLAGTVVKAPVDCEGATLPNSKEPVPSANKLAVKNLFSSCAAMVLVNGVGEPAGTWPARGKGGIPMIPLLSGWNPVEPLNHIGISTGALVKTKFPSPTLSRAI